MPKQTYQPKRSKRAKTHGFLSRMRTSSGRAVVQKRRRSGRMRLAVQD
ncbi:MAG: 50S ribosomal protein L34 [Minisyncoccia bacterium]